MNAGRVGRKDSRESTLFFGILIGLFLLVAALSLIAVSGQRRRNALLVEYEAEKLAAALLEAVRQGATPASLPLTDGLLGFGIYAGGGGALMRFGSAPLVLEAPDRLHGEGFLPEPAIRYDRERGSVTLIRSLGMPPHGRGRMPRMMDRGARDMQQLLYLELAVGRFYSRQRMLEAARLLLPLLTLGAMALVAVLYRNNQAIRRQLAEREQLARLGEASRTLTHEIKNPLSAIRIQTSLLKKTLPAGHAGELRVIEEEVLRLSVLTDRIGDFLRDPAGASESIELDGFIRELVLRYDRQIDYTSGVPGNARVVFDPQRLRSVLENLINNALEASDSDPVEIVLSRSKQEVIVRVFDRGPGIPKEIRGQVFDPFFTSKVRGSGVGLAIARRFVEAAGGSLALEARSGGGTEARIALRREGA